MTLLPKPAAAQGFRCPSFLFQQDFDKFDKFAVQFELDSNFLRKYFIQLASRSITQLDLWIIHSG